MGGIFTKFNNVLPIISLLVTVFMLGVQSIKVSIQHGIAARETKQQNHTLKKKLNQLHPTLRQILRNMKYTNMPIINSRPFNLATGDGLVKDNKGGGGVVLIDSVGNMITSRLPVDGCEKTD